MSDQSPVLDRLARRNPVPNPADPPAGAWDLEAVRLELMRREETVLTDERPTRTGLPKEPHRRNWLVAAAAFTVVLIFGVVFFVGGDADDPDPEPPATTEATVTTATTEAPTTTSSATPSPTTPVFDALTAADQIVAAIYANDMARVEELASATANLDLPRYLAGWVEASWEAFNTEILSSTCASTPASNVVKCTVEFSDDMLRAAGADRLAETWEIGFANELAQTLTFAPPEVSPLDPAFRALVTLNPEWFDAGGPCEGVWADGDPATCAPVLNEFVLGWFSPPTTEMLVEHAEALVTALYGDDRATVEVLESPSASRPDEVYYFLGWLQGLNTEVISTTCVPGAASNQVYCSVVASDDLQGAFGVESLEIEWDIQFSENLWQVASFAATSVDGNTADQWLMDFVAANTELFGPPLGVCDGFFSGGSTAFECGQTVVAAAVEATG